MAQYYGTCPSVAASAVTSDPDPSITVTVSNFGIYKHREALLSNDLEEGWALELCRYLETVQRDIKKDSDIVEWWQVSCSFFYKIYFY